MREPHVLQPTKTIRLPKRMIFFDSEAKVDIDITDEEIRRAEDGEEVRKEHHPYLICADFYYEHKGQTKSRERDYYIDELAGQTFKGGWSTFLTTFWIDVHKFTRVGMTTWMFAHNVKYDIQVTGGVAFLVDLGWTVVAMSDSNPFFLELEHYTTHNKKTGHLHGEYLTDAPDPEREYPEHKKPFYDPKKRLWFYPNPKTRTLKIISSTNYYAQNLKSLGKSFNLPKLDFDHEQPFTIEDAIIYCRRDVEILKKAMLTFIKFVEREQLGSFSITIAGQAFGAFRKRFMYPDTIHIHSDERALRVEREAYAGGRTECFYLGEVPRTVFYLDINSMYAHVMNAERFPTKLISFWEQGTIHQIDKQIKDGYLICCECYIETDKNIFHKKQKRLIFPVGNYWTALSTPEIIKGIEMGIIKEIKNICIYEGDYIFREYVQYFYTMRLKSKAEGDSVHDLLYKNFLTNLYGKFGQKNIKYEAVGITDPAEIDYVQVYHADTKERETFKIFGGKIWKEIKDEDDLEAFNSFPAIAAHVTAYARMLIWDAREEAGEGNSYYMDTDSLLVNADGYQNLWLSDYLDNKILGKLKLEDIGTLEIFGVKDYIFTSLFTAETIVKIKGISKSARSLDKSEDGKLRFAVTQWGGFTTRLKDKNFHDFYNKVIIKELKREYNKGIIEGNHIIPYTLDYKGEQLAQLEEEKKAYDEYQQMELKEYQTDYLMELCKIHGFILIQNKGDFYYREYQKIPAENKMKYFRRNRGIPLDEWCQTAGYTPTDLLELLIYGN